MAITKRELGTGYVTSSGVVLSLVLGLVVVVAADSHPVAAAVAATGLVPALAMAVASRWLSAVGFEGEQIWTVARWSSLGVAVLTAANLAVVATTQPRSVVEPVFLATAIALGGVVGALVGVAIELRATVRRLRRGKRVLARVVQHNLRNDLTVLLGHLGELEDEVSDDGRDRLRRLECKVDDIASTTEKARQLEAALAVDRRDRRPVDLVPFLAERLEAVERSAPGASIEFDAPDHAWVWADWFVRTVVENVVENAVQHGPDSPALRVVVDERPDVVHVRVVDDCPHIPENERHAFTDVAETSLDHSTGVGLWLVRFVMESYGGRVCHETRAGGGNAIELRFERAPPPDDATLGARVRRRLGRVHGHLGRVRSYLGRSP